LKTRNKLFSVSLTSTALTLLLILVLSMASGVIAQAAPFSVTETQITTSGSAEKPAIYGDVIVWQDFRNGKQGNGFNGTYDIYMYNLSTSNETRITRPGYAATDPAIYEDKIVWSDDRTGNFKIEKSDIYMYNLSSNQETRITANGSHARSPAIYGDKVVWGEYNSVHVYNLSTHEEINITGNGEVSLPKIYGNSIVWEDTLVSTDNGHSYRPYFYIYLYDLSTHKKTRIGTDPDSFPAIYEDRIVYADLRNGNPDLRTGNPNIYLYNISTSKETQITTSGSAGSPAIYGDRIVWLDGRSGDGDIYLYNLSTQKEFRITTSGSTEGPTVFGNGLAIFGNRIVWEGIFNGSANIYMCTISGEETERKTPVSNFTSSTTEGYAPLTVKFTDLSKNATRWNWDFGDGNNSTQQNPEHTYSAAGYYRVTLTASNEYGTDVKRIGINVQNAPHTTPAGFNFLIFGMLVLYLLRKST
jgi:beta propeller repeat protein